VIAYLTSVGLFTHPMILPWRFELVSELKAACYSVDANTLATFSISDTAKMKPSIHVCCDLDVDVIAY
jgi:hypothetical protein